MNMKSLRTGIAAAMGGAVLVAGLLVGASLAFAQEGEDPNPSEAPQEESALGGLFGLVEDVVGSASGEGGDPAALEEIAADLVAEIEPLVEEIRQKVLAAVDEAVAAGAITEERGDAFRERIEAFALPDGFPFPEHRLPWGDRGFALDGDCFRFRIDPDGAELDEDCPDMEFLEGFPSFPEGFPFGPRGFGFDGAPFEFFKEDIDEFLGDFELDLGELQERLESGMNLDESLEDLDVDLEELLSDARADALAKLDELVEKGELSQEQADSIKEMLEGIDLSDGLPFGIGRFGFGMDMEDFFEDFDFEDFDFEGFDFGEFRFDRFHGPSRGYDDSDSPNAEDAVLDV